LSLAVACSASAPTGRSRARAQRAKPAPWRACRADRRAQFHQRHRKSRRVGIIGQQRIDIGEITWRRRGGVGPAVHRPGNHAANIGVDDGHALPVCENRRRRGRYRRRSRAASKASRHPTAPHRRTARRSPSRIDVAAWPAADNRACPKSAAHRPRRRRRSPTASASGPPTPARPVRPRATGVCCSMNSLTRICHGVTFDRRHGRSRRARARTTVITHVNRSLPHTPAQCRPCPTRPPRSHGKHSRRVTSDLLRASPSTRAKASRTAPAWRHRSSPPRWYSDVPTAGWRPRSFSIRALATCSSCAPRATSSTPRCSARSNTRSRCSTCH